MKYLEKLLNQISIGILIIDKKGYQYYSNYKAEIFLDAYSKKLHTNDPIPEILKLITKDYTVRLTINSYNDFILRTIILDDSYEKTIYGISIYDTAYLRNFIGEMDFEEFMTILDYTQDAIIIDDKNGNTQWINKAGEKLYHVQRSDIIGKNVDYLEKAGIFSPSVAKLAIEKKENISILHSNKEGKKILTTGSPIFDKNGELQKIITTSRDITELIHLKNQLEDMQNKLDELQEKNKHPESIGNIVIKSPIMREVVTLAKRLAQIDSTLLITGESGVGKGILSRYIHDIGPRKDKPFIAVNCGAIPDSLLESELFGYEHGAFTGSRKQGKIGMFEMAHGGTILLDEIAEMPMHLQVKILQVIQEKQIQRIGGVSVIPVDVRIIAATNRDLRAMVKEGKFREDLFYRLNVVPIHIPPLRERREDIIPLINHALQKYNQKFNERKRIDPNAMEILVKYKWPGNVRELENIIERLVITTRNDIILPYHLPKYITAAEEDDSDKNNEDIADIKIPIKINLKDAIEEVEKQILQTAAAKYKTTRQIAKALGVSQPTIVRKMNRYNIQAAQEEEFDS
ncbi:MAG TPA: sigma 54-interacting transcriptional regulator [Clostridiales bacterium]|nr:sigma 54-interacting transcriptional regulator [Clostridiales bacterium]